MGLRDRKASHFKLMETLDGRIDNEQAELIAYIGCKLGIWRIQYSEGIRSDLLAEYPDEDWQTSDLLNGKFCPYLINIISEE